MKPSEYLQRTSPSPAEAAGINPLLVPSEIRDNDVKNLPNHVCLVNPLPIPSLVVSIIIIWKIGILGRRDDERAQQFLYRRISRFAKRRR